MHIALTVNICYCCSFALLFMFNEGRETRSNKRHIHDSDNNHSEAGSEFSRASSPCTIDYGMFTNFLAVIQEE